ncbi:MAG: oligosaccharide flippase family protein, partial [Flavobacteriales bacterium]|nr:oligosaccharide flippase family protein [Flavobacteriales bacterium]
MGIIQRQAFLNTFINYAGVVIGFVNVVILFPLFLNQEEFGLTRLVLSLISVMAQMSSFGVHRIAIKFFPIFRKEERKNNGLFLMLFLLSISGTIIISLIYFLFKQPILHFYQDEASLFNDYYKWIPLATLGMVVFIVFESFLQALRKTVFTNFLRNIIVRVYWLVALFFYYKGYCTFYQFMLIYMLGYFFTAALCVVQLMANKELSFDVNKTYFKSRLLKPIINYGGYTIFSGLTLMLVVNVDTLMIGALLPEDKLTFVGVYAVATYIASVIVVPNAALARIASPLIAHDWRVKNLKNIDEVYKKSSVLMSFAGGIIYGAIAI